jgi:hypothetical protein
VSIVIRRTFAGVSVTGGGLATKDQRVEMVSSLGGARCLSKFIMRLNSQDIKNVPLLFGCQRSLGCLSVDSDNG